MSEYPEHRGGDRMNQIVPLAGKRGPALRFHDWVERRRVAVATYNATPQHGRLAGVSPNEEANRRGWPKVECPREILDCVFARDDKRMITRGAFTMGKDHNRKLRIYYHARLQRFSGRTLALRVPLGHAHDHVWVSTAPGKGLWVERKPVHAENDGEGARWQGVQWSVLRGEIKQIEARTEAVDMMALDAAANAEGQGVTPRIVGRVQANDDIEAAATALTKLPKPKPRRGAPFIDEELERWRTRPPRAVAGGATDE
jgi:hypothetical protein